MNANKQLQFQIRLADAETEATTWSLADTECVTTQLEREIYGITSNEQKWFKEELSIHLIEFEAWRETIGIQVLRKITKQYVIHFTYPMMHHASHISESVQGMGSAYNFTTDISERLHISNVRQGYRSSYEVNNIRQMLMHNDRCTGLDYVE